MSLDNAYDGLAAVSDTAFYATAGNKLYLLDPVAGTEMEIGTTPSNRNNSLEFAGAMLMDFSATTSALMELNEASGSLANGPWSIGVSDLRGIVLMNRADEPRQFVMYD